MVFKSEAEEKKRTTGWAKRGTAPKFPSIENYSFVYNTGEAVSLYTYSDFASPGVFLALKFGWFK